MTKPVLPCTCSRYRTETGKTTGCTQWTPSRFAPGHDAKLKSFLVTAGVAGEQVTEFAPTDTGTDDRTMSAVEHAGALGYGAKVAEGIDREVARRVARKLGDMGQVRSPKVSDELARAAQQSDQEFAEAERKKITDREASADW